MSRYLLDTHAWLWFAVSPERLSASVRTVLLDPASEVWISVASVWELAIKSALGKLVLPGTVTEFVASHGRAAGFAILSIEDHHAAAVASLPRHHGDPFDRLLVCQAQLEEMVLVTFDPKLEPYGVPTLSPR